MDELDRRIIELLRQDARLPVAELARRAQTSRATLHERLKRLQSTVIRGSTVVLDPAALGRPLRAFLLISWRAERNDDQRSVARQIAAIAGIERVHITSGQHDFLVEVVARDMDEVGRLIIERIRALPGVGGTETVLTFWTFDGAGVPLQ